MNDDTIYKLYRDKYYDLPLRVKYYEMQSFHYKLFALRTHLWSLKTVFKGIILKKYFAVKRFFRGVK